MQSIITLIFISITGLVVLGGHVDHIPDPNANFRNSFEGTTDNGNDLATALVNIIFSYTGYSNAFNVVNEIKNPIPVLKRHATISVVVVAVLYMFCNVAYFAAVPKAEFKTAKEIAAAVFFTKVFGTGPAEQALNFLVLLSAFGNLLGVLIGSSRVIREIGRQGVLPWTEFWVNTKPFGTPIGPYFLKWIMTFIMIAAPPAGDAFQFVISLKTYPDGLFHFAMAVGVYLIRVRRKRAGLGRTEFKSWHVTVIFFILLQVYILVMPWWPPKGGPYAGSVSFWYATYCVVGIAILNTRDLSVRRELMKQDNHLMNLCSTCKLFRLVAQPIAYQSIFNYNHINWGLSLSTFLHRFGSLTKTLSERPDLAANVTFLDIHVLDRFEDDGRVPSKATHEQKLAVSRLSSRVGLEINITEDWLDWDIAEAYFQILMVLLPNLSHTNICLPGSWKLESLSA
ncbi:hypothetical protein K4K58_001398 [Colletotrichum sp. SAR11_239]|nr:hypothetical protein K4K58_001398 [Colletotrichum sp. SAR11_239]